MLTKLPIPWKREGIKIETTRALSEQDMRHAAPLMLYVLQNIGASVHEHPRLAAATVYIFFFVSSFWQKRTRPEDRLGMCYMV